MAITMTVTTTSYAVTAAANTAYAVTAIDTITPVEDTTYNLLDGDNELLIDANLIYIVDSEG